MIQNLVNNWGLSGAGLLYVCQAIVFLHHGKVAMAIVMVSYGMANLALLFVYP